MEETGLMNTGTRTSIITLLSGELACMVYDARWMILAIFLCVVADFRYGWGESSKRYALAKEKGNEILMAQYKWRTSRALRRSVNKMIDYIIWLAVGMIVGIAIIKPLGVDCISGVLVATTLAVGCELKSIVGHLMFLHGVVLEQKTIKGFLKAFVIALAKRKNRDVGEAIEEGFNEIEGKNKNEGN